MHMLEINDLEFAVKAGEGPVIGGERAIIDGLTLDIDEGKLIVITGPNGSGKSTTAKLIMGIEEPTGGSIVFDGHDITHMPIDERARLGIGYGFQQPAKFTGMKVAKLIRIASGQKLTAEKCNHYLTSVGLCSADYLKRDVDKSLSGGELKRIEIATVLARNPRLAIFDEPEAGIDLWSFERLCETFRTFHETQPDHTLVIISHQERIMALADEIVVIENGTVARRGARDEIMPTLGISQTSDPNCSFTHTIGAMEAAVVAAEKEA